MRNSGLHSFAVALFFLVACGPSTSESRELPVHGLQAVVGSAVTQGTDSKPDSHGVKDGVGHLPDNHSPIVSEIAVSELAWNRATITWLSSEPATTRVEFGLTAELGSFVEDPGILGTFHRVELTGLPADSQIHYQVISEDAFGNVFSGPKDQFSTPAHPPVTLLTGERRLWLPLTINVLGPAAAERNVYPNPFLDYRLVIALVSPSGETHLVHGFFDGNGVGGSSGSVYRARFLPTETGLWTYALSFAQGPEIAIDLDLGAGTPLFPDGMENNFVVGPADVNAPGFYRRGPLTYTGAHYLRFANGQYFLKGGCNSPENLLGYAGIDNTSDQPGGASAPGLVAGLHQFQAHVGDFGPQGLGDDSDPLFTAAQTGFDSRGIVGAMNYLSSVHVNSLYFLPMNLGGDARDTCPFVSYDGDGFDKTHYDISKLTQWNTLFEHAQRKGILLHIVLAEQEPSNTLYLDGGDLGVERKLFYRELVARFGHLPAIQWNLSEENKYSSESLADFADYIQALDPLDHPITFHTHSLPPTGAFPLYSEYLGDPRFSAASLQANLNIAETAVEKWWLDSEAAGRPWIVGFDEQTTGASDQNADELRRNVLYDVYFSGGQVEWYAGLYGPPIGGDVDLEDFRTRDQLWQYTWYARRFMERELRFWIMKPMDELVSGESGLLGGAEVFAQPGVTYAVYFPNTQHTGTIDLSAAPGSFNKSWYNPRTGEFEGPTTIVTGGATLANGDPPDGGSWGKDWVLLYKQ